MNARLMRFASPEETLASARSERLEPGVIHVWPLALTGLDSSRERLAAILTAEERARAGRYYFERDRHAFVFSRGQMRWLLGRYCAVGPDELQLVSGESGKPSLAPDQPFAKGISFNFTHSSGRALLAVCGGSVGVDLECHDRKTDVMALASRYFFGSEYEAILQAAEDERIAAFFRFWTAKEAVIKAQGIGLGAPLNCFRVQPGEVLHASPVDSFDTSYIDGGWFTQRLPCAPGWSAALATRDRHARVRLMPD